MLIGYLMKLRSLSLLLRKHRYQVVEYPLLEVIIRYQHGGKESTILALNESTVKSVEGTLVMDVEIKRTAF